MPKMKEIQKVVKKLSRGQESAAGGVQTGTKTLSPPVYREDLIIIITRATFETSNYPRRP